MQCAGLPQEKHHVHGFTKQLMVRMSGLPDLFPCISLLRLQACSASIQTNGNKELNRATHKQVLCTVQGGIRSCVDTARNAILDCAQDLYCECQSRVLSRQHLARRATQACPSDGVKIIWETFF